MVNTLIYMFSFVLGSFVGSFLNVVADRLAVGENPLFGRSRCGTCKSVLGVKDLIPLFSFLFLKGKCRYCKKELSKFYPISETLTGFVFMALVAYSGVLNDLHSIKLWFGVFYLVIVACTYVTIFLSDAKYQIIPDKVVIPAIIFVFLAVVLTNALSLGVFYKQLQLDSFGKYLITAGFWHNQLIHALRGFVFTLLSSLSVSAFFIFLIFITKGRGMGFGDVKLGFLIGLVNGFPQNILAIFLGFLFGALYSVGLLTLRKKGMKDAIAFGPFLILGSVVSFVWGTSLLDWYFGIF